MNALRSALLTGLLVSVAVAACGGAASPSPSTTAPPTEPPPTQVPGGSLGSAPPSDGIVGGGGSGSNPGAPGVPPLSIPKPGATVNPRPVAIETLEAQIDGRKAVILATWWSGVEPCYVLDTVDVKQEGNAFTITLTEGSLPGDQMCIELAQQHATAIDLGELEPGEYRVSASEGSTAAPITFTIDE